MAGKRNMNPNSLKNLEKGRKTQFKSGDKAAIESGYEGGKQLGENNRRRKSMAELARKIALAPAPDKAKTQLAKLGFEDEDMNGNAMVVAGVYNNAVKGNMIAVEKWEQLTEEKSEDEKTFELPARVVAKSFVDLNRQIEPNMTYVIKGGRGSTKSSFVSMKILEIIKNNPMLHACCVRKVGGTLKDSVYAQLKWAIGELGLESEFQCKSNPLEIIYKKTGQIIYFRGCDDPLKLKSIKPPFGYIGILWIEERDQLAGAEEERSVTQSVLRGGDLSYDFKTYNPPKSRDNWVNLELLEPNPRRIVHESTYLDVPQEWLGQKFIDDAEHLKEVNPNAYEHEYLGVANGDGGNVFENLEIRKITDKEIEWFDHIFMGVDWGWYPDPFAFIRLHYDAKNEVIYFIDEIRANKTPNEETARMIKERGYTDASITCDCAEPKSVADFRACGLPAKEAVKGAGSVAYSMKWLQNRRIVIDPNRTPEAYKEFMGYEYERSRTGEVISGFPDKNNHFIDATRYALERVYKKYGSVG